MDRRLALLSIAAFSAGLAHAADQPILGSMFQVKNPSTTDKRKIVVKAKEKLSPNTIVGNPVTNGGALVINAFGGTSSGQAFPLGQGISITGKPFWTGDPVKGFKYKDPHGQQGPVKSAQIKRSPNGNFSIKAIVAGKLGPVTVVPPNPGTSACAVLAIGLGDSYSVAFLPGDGTVVNKGAILYKHKKPTLQGTCLTPTTTTSTSTTTSSTTSTTLYGSPSRAFVDRVLGLLD